MNYVEEELFIIKYKPKGKNARNMIIERMKDGSEKGVMKIINNHFPRLITTEALITKCAKEKVFDGNGEKIKTFGEIEQIVRGLDLKGMVSITNATSTANANCGNIQLGGQFYLFEK